MLYDTIIIGSGPAGLTASIYASRYKMSNIVIGKIPGGTITYAHKVENFPGLPGISGAELGQKMAGQAKGLGAEILVEGAAGIEKKTDGQGGLGGKENFRVITESGREFEAKTVVVATGTERRKLNVPGEKEYLGKGVSYCVTCDAPFFKGKTVVLVGGSNAACSGAIHLANFALKIYLIYRKAELRAEPVWVEEIKNNPKIEVIYNSVVTEILGEGAKVTGVKLGRGNEDGKNSKGELKADGIFVEIGGIPAVEFLKPLKVEFDEGGYIKVGERMETNITGLFAAGDVTDKSLILSQAITSCAQGAAAANSAFEFLRSKN